MICYPDRCRSRIHLFNRSLSGQYQAHKPQCCLSSRSRMWVNHRVNNAKQIWSVWDSSAGHDQAGHAPEEQFQLWERRGGRELAQGCHAPRPRRAGFRRLRPNPWFKIHVSPSTWEADRTLKGLSCQPRPPRRWTFLPVSEVENAFKSTVTICLSCGCRLRAPDIHVFCIEPG